MTDNYVDQLGLSSPDMDKINVLGLPDSLALLGMLKANPEASENYFGEELMEQLQNGLEALLPQDQIDDLERPLPNFNISGVAINASPPTLSDLLGYDTSERDSLHQRLKELRSQPRDYAKAQEIDLLEQRLEDVLERHTNRARQPVFG
jgi:hypothetical protein